MREIALASAFFPCTPKWQPVYGVLRKCHGSCKGSIPYTHVSNPSFLSIIYADTIANVFAKAIADIFADAIIEKITNVFADTVADTFIKPPHWLTRAS